MIREMLFLALSFWGVGLVNTSAMPVIGGCMPTGVMLEVMTREGASIVWSGTNRQDHMVIVWQSDSGWWAVSTVSPDGRACIRSTGTDGSAAARGPTP